MYSTRHFKRDFNILVTFENGDMSGIMLHGLKRDEFSQRERVLSRSYFSSSFSDCVVYDKMDTIVNESVLFSVSCFIIILN